MCDIVSPDGNAELKGVVCDKIDASPTLANNNNKKHELSLTDDDDLIKIYKRRKTRRGRSKRNKNMNNSINSSFNRNPNMGNNSRNNTNNNNNNSSINSKPTWKDKRPPDRKRMRAPYNQSKIQKPKQPLAPYNTNQFLLEDHAGNVEFDQHLMADIKNGESHNKNQHQPRTRDSSFSVDEDLDTFYSSPEDEEEFLTKEFSNTYQDMRSERLNTMTREQLVQECVQLENRLELMTKCWANVNEEDGNTSTTKHGDSLKSAELTVRFEFEMKNILVENEQLRRENEILRRKVELKSAPKHRSESSGSVDSESDSSSSSESSSNSSSCSSENCAMSRVKRRKSTSSKCEDASGDENVDHRDEDLVSGEQPNDKKADGDSTVDDDIQNTREKESEQKDEVD